LRCEQALDFKVPSAELAAKGVAQAGLKRPAAEVSVGSAPAWFRFLVPSVADLIFLILLVALTYGALAPKLLGDAGTGWHLRDGQRILQTHAFPRTDSFSSTMSGRPWYAWEWLFDVAIAGVHHWMGLNGVVFFAALVIAAAFAVLFRFTVKRGGSLPVTVILLVLSIGASTIHLFARPHVLSWLLTVIWFRALDASETAPAGRDHRLFWLPVLMLLWANVHGGFLLGFALLGLYLAGGAIEYFISRPPVETQLAAPPAGDRQTIAKRLMHLATITALALLASLVNPYGYKLHLHVYQYLTNRFLMNHIDEFLSPNFHGVAQQCFAALLLITMLALASARTRLRPTHLLVIFFAAYSGLYASRNLPTSAILLTLMVAPILSQTIATNVGLPAWMQRLFYHLHSFSERMDNMEVRLRGHLWPIALAIFGFAVCLHQGYLGSRQVLHAHFDAKRFPVQAVNAIAQGDNRAPIFAPDYWGGYLIYRLYPQTLAVVDDRHDLYGEQFLKDYLRVTRVAPGWDRVLDERGITCVLAPADSSLANILKENAGWRVTYEDKVALLFERSK
jgi:hypothetical protein